MIEGIGEGVIQSGSEWTREAFESRGGKEGGGWTRSSGGENDLGDFMLFPTSE